MSGRMEIVEVGGEDWAVIGSSGQSDYETRIVTLWRLRDGLRARARYEVLEKPVVRVRLLEGDDDE